MQVNAVEVKGNPRLLEKVEFIPQSEVERRFLARLVDSPQRSFGEFEDPDYVVIITDNHRLEKFSGVVIADTRSDERIEARIVSGTSTTGLVSEA